MISKIYKRAAVLCAQGKLKPNMTYAVRARRDTVSAYTSQTLATDVGAALYEVVPDLISESG